MKRERKKLKHWQIVTLLLLAYDFIAVIISYFAALWLRFDCRFTGIEKSYLQAYYRNICIYALICVIVYWFLKLYKTIWRFASYAELIRVMAATAVTGSIHILYMTVIGRRMPVSYYIFGLVIQFCLTLGVRFSYRFILLLRGRRDETQEEKR
ncbi:MAG: hypothetical protein Q4B72_12290 [Lachnospiraceae bacterium]|nr:hypothetical protein [Lachnospiraceae bacterium]